jgi:hypothetical protein
VARASTSLRSDLALGELEQALYDRDIRVDEMRAGQETGTSFVFSGGRFFCCDCAPDVLPRSFSHECKRVEALHPVRHQATHSGGMSDAGIEAIPAAINPTGHDSRSHLRNHLQSRLFPRSIHRVC